MSEAQELAELIEQELNLFADWGHGCSAVIRYATWEEPTWYCENDREFASPFCIEHEWVSND
jgi:hypothetical protein